MRVPLAIPAVPERPRCVKLAVDRLGDWTGSGTAGSGTGNLRAYPCPMLSTYGEVGPIFYDFSCLLDLPI